ncbi:MAG: FAA hydrolase family protein, partial [Alphaproteobacteria bacterium]
MSFVFDPAAIPTLPIEGREHEYPVHRIFCVGRNYVAHADEMGVKVDRESPFYFLKSDHHLYLAQGNIPMAPR